MTKENPFPGMNPFLERHWSDVHTKLITYIADALAEQMPPGLNARSEERVTLHSADDDGGALRPDVAVIAKCTGSRCGNPCPTSAFPCARPTPTQSCGSSL